MPDLARVASVDQLKKSLSMVITGMLGTTHDMIERTSVRKKESAKSKFKFTYNPCYIYMLYKLNYGLTGLDESIYESSPQV